MNLQDRKPKIKFLLDANTRHPQPYRAVSFLTKIPNMKKQVLLVILFIELAAAVHWDGPNCLTITKTDNRLAVRAVKTTGTPRNAIVCILTSIVLTSSLSCLPQTGCQDLYFVISLPTQTLSISLLLDGCY
jgi:hypothetical protein